MAFLVCLTNLVWADWKVQVYLEVVPQEKGPVLLRVLGEKEVDLLLEKGVKVLSLEKKFHLVDFQQVLPGVKEVEGQINHRSRFIARMEKVARTLAQ